MSNNTKPIESSAMASGKLHPAIPGIGSFLLMGVGQAINKNWIKALCFFLVPVLVCVVEFSSSNWGKYISLKSHSTDELISTQVVDYGEYATIEEEADYLGIEDDFDWASMFAADAEEDWEDEYYEDEYEEEVPQYEYPIYDLSPNGEKYVVRDFGGFFTKGIWGLVTLGRVVLDQEYAGKIMTLNNYTSRWLTADNSTVLLGNGLITLVFVILYIMAWVLCVIDAIKERKSINEDRKSVV